MIFLGNPANQNPYRPGNPYAPQQGKYKLNFSNKTMNLFSGNTGYQNPYPQQQGR